MEVMMNGCAFICKKLHFCVSNNKMMECIAHGERFACLIKRGNYGR